MQEKSDLQWSQPQVVVGASPLGVKIKGVSESPVDEAHRQRCLG